MEQFTSQFPFAIYYVHYSCYLNEIYKKLEIQMQNLKFIQQYMHSINEIRNFEKQVQDLITEHNYIDDIFITSRPNICYMFSNSILLYAILPTVINGFKLKQENSKGILFYYYILFQILNEITYQPFLRSVLTILFKKDIEVNLYSYLNQIQQPPLSYQKIWQATNFWDQHQQQIQQQLDFEYNNHHQRYNVLYPDVKEEKSKLSYYQSIIGYYMFQSDDKYEKEHQKISKVLGFSTLRNAKDQNFQCITKLIEDYYFLYQQKQDEQILNLEIQQQEETKQNEFRNTLFNNFNSKKEYLMCFNCLLIQNVYTNAHKIDQDGNKFLQFIDLKDDQNDQQINQQLQDILDLCYKTIISEPHYYYQSKVIILQFILKLQILNSSLNQNNLNQYIEIIQEYAQKILNNLNFELVFDYLKLHLQKMIENINQFSSYDLNRKIEIYKNLSLVQSDVKSLFIQIKMQIKWICVKLLQIISILFIQQKLYIILTNQLIIFHKIKKIMTITRIAIIVIILIKKQIGKFKQNSYFYINQFFFVIYQNVNNQVVQIHKFNLCYINASLDQNNIYFLIKTFNNKDQQISQEILLSFEDNLNIFGIIKDYINMNNENLLQQINGFLTIN